MGLLFCIGKGDARTRDSKVGKRGQGNFKLAANFGYRSRGSADPRESLRRCWISKLALTAHKVLPEQKAEARFWVVNWGRIEWLRGRFREKGTGRITVVGSDPSRAFLGRL